MENELAPILTEIRDQVREQTALMQEMNRRSAEFQDRAMRASEAQFKLYRRVVFGGGLIILAVVIAIVVLMLPQLYR